MPEEFRSLQLLKIGPLTFRTGRRMNADEPAAAANVLLEGVARCSSLSKASLFEFAKISARYCFSAGTVNTEGSSETSTPNPFRVPSSRSAAALAARLSCTKPLPFFW